LRCYGWHKASTHQARHEASIVIKAGHVSSRLSCCLGCLVDWGWCNRRLLLLLLSGSCELPLWYLWLHLWLHLRLRCELRLWLHLWLALRLHLWLNL